MTPIRRLVAITLGLALAGCASIPAPIGGSFGARTPADPGPDGERVRWGGPIVATEPGATETCLEVLARPLGPNARPNDTDRALGRFLACRGGFIDPAVFAAGREVTVVGRVVGRAPRTLGGFSYDVPRVEAEAIHLWPRRVPFDPRCVDPWHRGPWPWPGPGWWGPRHPYWWW
jgi:outer membrane lipoprotein